ncbi:MAG TPA: hemerythrin domain-containing protein [Gallionella sp.]|nr:hemerythrin domain-containing protein [Gallionella sp.]
MPTISEIMTKSHKACDYEFARAEDAALNDHWGEAGDALNSFRTRMAHHFRLEEEVLFPALVAAGGPAGPVQVMHMEHSQINDLMGQMAAALTARDGKKYDGISETLLVVMQQHNIKEEQILYPIADRLLAADHETFLGRMLAV